MLLEFFSCFRWISVSKEGYEQRLKKHIILPFCYQLELQISSMISKMMSGRYLYDFAAGIDFHPYDCNFRHH